MHRAPAKEVHFLRVVPLLPLLHTNKRYKHVSRSVIRLTAFADTDVSRVVISVIALYVSQFYSSHFPIIVSLVFRDQFRYIKIQPKTIDFNTRLLGINPTNSVVIPMSLVLRSIVLG